MAAARDRVRAALRLLGPIGADVAWCVCGEGQSARDWALRTGRLKGAGMILLRAALETLVDHYDPRRREPTGILAWIAADAPANQAVGRDAA